MRWPTWMLTDNYMREDTPKYRALINIMNQPDIKINIGVPIPGSIEGRQIIGKKFFGQWQNVSSQTVLLTNNFGYYLVRSDFEEPYYMDFLVSSTVLTEIKIEVNNLIVSVLDIGNTQGLPKMMDHVIANFKEKFNVIKFTVIKGAFTIYNITVHFEKPPSVVTSNLRPSGYQSIPFSYQTKATNYPILFSVENLPRGLKIDSASGVISGIPEINGEFQIVLTILNEITESKATLYLTVFSSLLLAESFD